MPTPFAANDGEVLSLPIGRIRFSPPRPRLAG